MRARPHVITLIALTLSLALASRAASAQDASPAVDVLLSSHNIRARIRAANAIGRTRPREGRRALEAALVDPAPRVRGAAADALAAFGDPGAVPTLLAHGDDRNVQVRDAITRAVTQLNAHAPRRVPLGTFPTVLSIEALTAPVAPVNWRRVRYVVGVSTVVNRAPEAAAYSPVVRAAIEQELNGHAGVAMRPARLPASVAARMRVGAVHIFSLEGGVSSLHPVTVPAMSAMRAEVSLLLIAEPSHAIVGTITGAATAQQPIAPGGSARFDDPLTTHAIQAAIRSALTHIEQTLEGIHAR